VNERAHTEEVSTHTCTCIHTRTKAEEKEQQKQIEKKIDWPRQQEIAYMDRRLKKR